MYLLIILITIFLVFSILSMNLNINEHYCKVPPTNNQGEDNFFKADLSFKPQSNINNSNCDKYWKKFSNESNSVLNLNEPIPIKGDQLKLPQEAGFGNHIYKFGLINFKELASYLNNQESNINKNIYNDKTTEKLIINPINKEKLDYLYKVDFFITTMNKKTDIKRFNEYNPTQLNNFKQIQSPIPQVNILNNEFLKRINKEQIKVMSKRDIIISGKLEYQLYSYRIIDIKYINKNPNQPIFVIQVNLFQEYNYYINSFAYQGYLDINNQNKNNQNNPIIINTEFMGVNINSEFLNTPGYDKNKPTDFFVLNKNFNDFQPRLDDIDKVIDIVDNKKKLNALDSAYACFNTDPDSSNSFLNYNNKTLCESALDPFGRPKAVGVYDKPCEKNEECPFYQSNKNYKNEFGGCINGKCQLPVNMKNIGYHFYSYNKNYSPLCYNCKKDNFNLLSTSIDDCCQEQFGKKSFQSPDYAFKNDTIPRINNYNQEFYKTKELV
jgi:hypothetical protein